MLLSRLIDPSHLQLDVVDRAMRTLRDDEFRSVVIDNFLRPSFAEGLLACFEEDGDFRLHHSLKQSNRIEEPGYEEHSVSQAEFEASPQARWLAREMVMNGPAPGRADSKGWRAHRQLLELLSSSAFQAYLSAVSAVTDLENVTFLARTMRFGDLCSAHSDAGDGRSLCMLLYIGDEWRPGFGGRFQNMIDGEVVRSTDPIGNRVILHRPAHQQIHRVEPIQDDGRRWRRHTYSVWFGPSSAALAAGSPSSA